MHIKCFFLIQLLFPPLQFPRYPHHDFPFQTASGLFSLNPPNSVNATSVLSVTTCKENQLPLLQQALCANSSSDNSGTFWVPPLLYWHFSWLDLNHAVPATVSSCLTNTVSLLMSIPFNSYHLSAPPYLDNDLSFGRRCDMDFPFRAKHSLVSYCLYIDQLWILLLIPICCKKLRDTLISGYKEKVIEVDYYIHFT